MAWESLKESLLAQLDALIERKGDAQHRPLLRALATVFFSRFPSEDLRGRSVDDLYGSLYGLLHFVRTWRREDAKVRLFNPNIETHGWEGRYTVVVILCRDMPFITASLRGELNRRQVRVHTINSCNMVCQRDSEGHLLEVAGIGSDDESAESLVYFEINPHTGDDELLALQQSLSDILAEVRIVVDDFEPMRARLHESMRTIQDSVLVEQSLREEAVDYLKWLERFHITFLGYEYLAVQGSGGAVEVSLQPEASLGLLRNRTTSGVADLSRDLQTYQQDELLRKQLSFSKSRVRSRVHRLAYPDFIEIKAYNARGEVIGQHRFMGLYTSSAYTMSPRLIPILRRKVQAVMEASGLDSRSHEGRELLRVVEMFPRDELFQSSIEELFVTCSAVNRIQERRKVRLFVREDPHSKFVNCLVYVPRDRFNTELRLQIEDILSAAFGAQESEFDTQFSESVLVRAHFVLRVDPAVALSYDVNEIEEQIVQATLSWEDRLRVRLAEEFGEETGDDWMRLLGRGFPPGYRDDFDPRVAVMDIRKIELLRGGDQLALTLYRMLEEEDSKLRLRLYHHGISLPLSDVLPILENLGLRVVTERPYGVRAEGGDTYWVQEFSLIYSLAHDIDLDEVKDEFEDAFTRIWFGEAESDSFNRLLLGTRLNWREIALFRAAASHLRQVNFTYSPEYIAETLAHHLHITGMLVEFFLTRFSPAFDGDEDWRAQRELDLEGRILDSLDGVQNLGEDIVFRRFLAHIKAILRTNFFQEDGEGKLKSYFSFKLNPRAIPDMPQPVPMFEVYVYSPRVEGVHLRGGKVARGGLRWSDRHQDYRTEVLGLVKAQQVKNAVIVPVGAKGGFVAKRMTPDMSREEMQQEGIACYKLFIQGLLDITDNLVDERVVSPPYVVRKDEDDPYLVVAADKGTATFSDIANEIAADYRFWLGDAFASGGSAGYDHKKMGITARGAWVSVQRHFREFGIDVQSTPFTSVGIGDMAGDVFGNGMLASPCNKLVAAFNHLHIFIDPDPDPAVGFEERQRLFALPRSSWEDYDAEKISAGGGVFKRAAKSIPLTAQIRKRFGIKEMSLTPNELVRYLLLAEVDLLWNGGIGTYVKATSESHAQVGDKANDGVRINGKDLRARVVGEGGNLGMTQLARVEYSLNGGRCNTDFIDNAGGVDCSDHEVNIKILLNAVVKRGDLTEKHRNQLLEAMSDEVSDLVLKNNYRQVQAISLVERQAETRSGEYSRFIANLESGGMLDRQLEFLPSTEELSERRAQGKFLTRPELCVLVSYSKGILKEALINSDLGSDPYLSRAVQTAFPQRMLDEYAEEVEHHQLHREIMATQIANDVVNRMGLNFMLRLQKATGATFADTARAYTIVNEVFDLVRVWQDVESLDTRVEADIQLEMMMAINRLVRRASRWMIRNRRHRLVPAVCIDEFKPGAKRLQKALPELVRGRDAEQFAQTRDHYLEAGVPEELAGLIASGSRSYTHLGIIDASTTAKAELMEVAELYYSIGERLELDWFAKQINSATVENEWQALARDTFLEDLDRQQRALSIGALRHMDEKRDVEACLQRWQAQEEGLLLRWQEMRTELHGTQAPDFAMFAVANRELMDLAQSSLYE